jgi:uncharacterized protein involved in high-affinity Fe2+ transport
MSQEIHVGDIGTELRLVVEDDGEVVQLSDSTDIKVIMTRPDSTIIEKDGLFLTNGDDGIIYIKTVSGDFSMPGNYKVQIEVTFPDGFYSSSINTFRVYSNLR